MFCAKGKRRKRKRSRDCEKNDGESKFGNVLFVYMKRSQHQINSCGPRWNIYNKTPYVVQQFIAIAIAIQHFMKRKLTSHLLHSILTFTLSVKISNVAGKKINK